MELPPRTSLRVGEKNAKAEIPAGERRRDEGRPTPARAPPAGRDVRSASGEGGTGHPLRPFARGPPPGSQALRHQGGRAVRSEGRRFRIGTSDRRAGPDAPLAVPETLAYMAPEQTRAEALDSRADIYAPGALPYEDLTSEAPSGRDRGRPPKRHAKKNLTIPDGGRICRDPSLRPRRTGASPSGRDRPA